MRDPARRLAELAAEVREARRAGPVTTRPRAVPPPSRSRAGRDGRGRTALFARRVAVAALALALPFLALLRGSTWLYTAGLGTWTAVLLAAVLTFLLLAGYVLAAARWLGRRRSGASTGPGSRVPKRLIQGAAILVVAYCMYGLVFLSSANAGGHAVRSEYRSLHPLLRLAVGTLVLADGDLLVTDAARTVDDYAAMGLPPNEGSLHLEQADGWAHAVDLRTAGRSGLRNVLTRLYFDAIGFRTLRHVGTADHLHVSLPVPDR